MADIGVSFVDVPDLTRPIERSNRARRERLPLNNYPEWMPIELDLGDPASLALLRRIDLAWPQVPSEAADALAAVPARDTADQAGLDRRHSVVAGRYRRCTASRGRSGRRPARNGNAAPCRGGSGPPCAHRPTWRGQSDTCCGWRAATAVAAGNALAAERHNRPRGRQPAGHGSLHGTGHHSMVYRRRDCLAAGVGSAVAGTGRECCRRAGRAGCATGPGRNSGTLGTTIHACSCWQPASPIISASCCRPSSATAFVSP